MSDLGPLWRYYGAKYRSAPLYPPPEHGTIIEPFAGAAGYALRYPKRRVILVEANPTIAELWRFLIGATPRDIRSIPAVEHVDELPSRVPEGARALVGFTLNNGSVMPCRTLSAGRKTMRAMGRQYEGWNAAQRERVAQRVPQIRHWRVIEGNYSDAPRIRATWFVDAPYQEAGRLYPHRVEDFTDLGRWCRGLPGQVIVCENVGANWLPFEPFRVVKSGLSKRTSQEALWTNSISHPRLRGMTKPVDSLLAELRETLKEELRAEVRAELIAELQGGKSPAKTAKKAPAKPGPKTKAVTPAPAAKNASLKVKKGVRRTEDDVAAAADVLFGWFKANPGSRIEQAAKALGAPVKDLQLPVAKLKETKRVKTTGKLRGTKYTAKG